MAPGVAIKISAALVYAVASGLLSLLNRYILHSKRQPFDFPGFLIAVQAIVLGVLTSIGLCTCWYDESRASAYWPNQLTFKSCCRLATFGISYALDIILTQKALSYAPVPLVELVKTATPVVVLAFTAVFQVLCPSIQEVICVILICSGVAMATHSGGVAYDVRPGGLLISVLATLIAGLRVVIMQFLLQGNHRCPQGLLLMYFSPMLLMVGCVTFFATEIHQFTPLPEALAPSNIIETSALVALSSLLAFLLNYSEVWCIRVTSALVFTLVGAAKVVCLVVLIAFLSGHLLSPMATMGALLAVLSVTILKISKKKPSPTRNSSIPTQEVSVPVLARELLDPECQRHVHPSQPSHAAEDAHERS